MTIERAWYQVRRVAQTPRTFSNWPSLLRNMVAERAGRGSPSLSFVVRSGIELQCPNLPGARLPMYEQFAEDCYDREWLLGNEHPLCVLDIGAHVGAFAANIASGGDHVLVECYEPSPDSARFLVDNLVRNGFDERLRVHQLAVGATAGEAFLDDNKGGSVHNGLVDNDRRLVAGDDAWGNRGLVAVKTTTFDAAVAAAKEPVTVVKMDCEGGEYALVYASAPESWASVQRVVLEYHPVPGESWEELRAWLAGVGLHLVRHESRRPGLGTAWLSRNAPTDETSTSRRHVSPREQIQLESQDWCEIVERLLGADAELVAVSRWFCDSRVYRSGDRIAKIRRHDARPGAWHGVMREADILNSLGRSVTAGRQGPWEYSIQDALPGTPFSAHLFDQQQNAFSATQRLRVLRAAVRALGDLHRHRIAHGDLRPENILVDGDNLRLVDFDMASRGSRLQVAYRDWIGLGGKLGTRHPLWKLALFTFLPKSQTLYLRLRHALVHPQPAAIAPQADPDIAGLRHAWTLAESSAANARGQGLAYYALSYRGEHLTGERAWQFRWDAVERAVDFRGKSFVELGCNMGMLSSYARFAGATDVIGVDHDARIIEAATAVAVALESGAQFEVVDLMSGDDWESRLGGRDIASALSVVHWLPDPDRVLRFLAQHREVLYEGHDSLEAETRRLNALGFDRVEVIMTTERSRHLLHAMRGAA